MLPSELPAGGPLTLVSNPSDRASQLKPAGASLGHPKAFFLESSWKWNQTLCGLLCSASDTQPRESETHPSCRVDREFILFYCQMVFHRGDVPQFASPLTF